jgi:hypothetical protein
VKPRTSIAPPPLQPVPPHSAFNPVDPNSPRRIYTGVPRRASAPVQPAVPTPQAASTVPAPIPVSWTPGPQPVLVTPAPAEPAAPLIPVRRASTPAPLPTATTATPQPSASALLLSLRDPASIRKAIILREVLGLPKALQPTLIGAGTLWAR